MSLSIDKKYPIGTIVNIVRYDVVVDRKLNHIEDGASNVFDGMTTSIDDFDCTNIKFININIQPIICIEIRMVGQNDPDYIFKFQSLISDEIFTSTYQHYDDAEFFWQENDNGEQIAYQDIFNEVILILKDWHNDQPKSFVVMDNPDLDKTYYQALATRTICLLLMAHYQRFSGEELYVIDAVLSPFCNPSEFNRVFKLFSQSIQSNNLVMRGQSIIEFLNKSFIQRIDFKYQ